MTRPERLGPQRLPNGQTRFLVWAQHASRMILWLAAPEREIEMEPVGDGYFACEVGGLATGARYAFRINGGPLRPDPASRHQPQGVHRPSALIDTAFPWDDARFVPPSPRNTVLYELHVGAFTPEGTFDAVIPHLQRLHDFGVTTLELMPIAQFPGERNWGYDGVNLYAAHEAYGGVDGLRRLVNAAHRTGLAVVLDVVYNHLGPEGNYLREFGPYFTSKYRTPWGEAMNLDGAHSDHVRRFLIENALYWLDVCHVDGFRLDATHELVDHSAYTFMEELASTLHDWSARYNKPLFIMAENDRSDRRVILPQEVNGFGVDAVWLDDLHHALHVALTGETLSYYSDYKDPALLPKVLQEGFAYSGEYSVSRQRRHGTPSVDLPTDRFVVCVQNHDQIGNRMLGERLAGLTSFEGEKLAAGLLLCAPYVPLLFMGQEYGETSPFLYFVSHHDEALLRAVRQGRAAEFAEFEWEANPPDPGAQETFDRSKLDQTLRYHAPHAALYDLYKWLLALRREHPVLSSPYRDHIHVYYDHPYKLCMERVDHHEHLRIFFNLTHGQATITAPPAELRWQRLLASSEWGTELTAEAPPVLEQGEQRVPLLPLAFAIYQTTPTQ